MEDLAGIAVFVQVAQARGFAEAARQLGITPSGVSKAVGRLERRLGAQLLFRTTRSVNLTPDGAAFYERCRQALADLREAESALSDIRSRPRGTLRVDLPVSLGRLAIVPALPGFLERYPELTLEISLTDRLVDIVEEGFDAVVRISGALPDSSLVARKVAETSFPVCASPEYLHQNGVPRTPEDLLEHRCIGFLYPQTRRPFLWRFRRHGRIETLPITGALRVNNGDALVAAAVAGAGLIQPNNFLVCRALEEGTLEPVLSEYLAEGPSIYVMYPPTKQLSAKVRAFVEFMAAISPAFSTKPETVEPA